MCSPTGVHSSVCEQVGPHHSFIILNEYIDGPTVPHAHHPLGSIQQISVRTANGTGPQCGSMDQKRLGRV